jgi:small-conductance mechanosensitive channel
LVVILIWITAIIVAFPYIPGSQTPAFRGITVLAGLMISLGAGNSIAQLVGGLVMVYNRTCRAGDFVRVGEYEGTITTVGFFSSRLVTGRNEEIVLPNSQISGGTLINYSRLNETTGVLVPTTVTIGYNTPWRQVHALLLEAARRTLGLKSLPQPIVFQTQLSDFYVAYELRVALEKPAERVAVLSQLHAHIQDVFNEHGVQIMSPHYETDPPQTVFVPREKWYPPPAKPGT